MKKVIIEYNCETKKYDITEIYSDGSTFVRHLDPEAAEYIYGFRG